MDHATPNQRGYLQIKCAICLVADLPWIAVNCIWGSAGGSGGGAGGLASSILVTVSVVFIAFTSGVRCADGVFSDGVEREFAAGWQGGSGRSRPDESSERAAPRCDAPSECVHQAAGHPCATCIDARTEKGADSPAACTAAADVDACGITRTGTAKAADALV